jgi:cytochrome c-type biogenesis protein CcmH
VRRAAALAAVAVLALAGAGGASAATPKTTLNDVEDELMCDTCNVPLNIAESERADEERSEIRDLIAQGLTKQQILDRFAKDYGPNILAQPTGGGAAVTVWLVPVLVIVGVAGALLLVLPRWRRRRAEEQGGDDAEPPLPPEDAQRLERDLALYD